MPTKVAKKVKAAPPQTRRRKEPELDIGATIDALGALREKRLAMEKDVDAVKAQETEMRGQLINLLGRTGQTRAAGVFSSVSLHEKTRPVIEDWNKVYAYIGKTRAFHLLQKRFNVSALTELWDGGVKIPGVQPERFMDLSLSKLSR